MDTPGIPTKRCKKCKQEFPATTEYFMSHKASGGLYPRCHACRREDKREAYQRNRESDVMRSKQYAQKNRERLKQYKHDWYIKNAAHIKAKEKVNYQANKQQKLDYGRTYYRKNRLQIIATEGERKKKKRQENPEPERINTRNRRARKKALPNTLTSQEWEQTLRDFNGCCAVCGRPPGLWHTLAADHWIPLSSPDCPGTVVHNMVPLCHGVGGCNNTKHIQNALDWLVDVYGKRKGKQIHQRITLYLAHRKCGL